MQMNRVAVGLAQDVFIHQARYACIRGGDELLPVCSFHVLVLVTFDNFVKGCFVQTGA